METMERTRFERSMITFDSSTLLKSTIAAGLGGLAFFRLIRPWYLHWGATNVEIERPMPLDERIPEPRLNSTMAITIDAPREEVWPWLVQMGDPPRAGYYSYTWIERMVGMHITNAGVVLPEHQTVHVGQALDKGGTMVVQSVEPGCHLVLGPPETVDLVKCTWAFGLYPNGDNATRLVTRVRANWNYLQTLKETPAYGWPFWLAIEPGAFIMERKMLFEIKRLAEADHAEAQVTEHDAHALAA